MSEYQSPLGTLSSGGQLHGDAGGGPTPPPRKPWVAVLVVALVALVALVIVAGAAFLLLSGDDDSSDDPASTQAGPEGTEDHIEERDVQPAEPEAPAEPREEEPSSPSEPASLLSAAGTGEALDEIRAAARGGKAITLRVDSKAVTAVVKGAVLLYRDGELQKLPGPPSAPIGFDLDDVDDFAPSRIEKAVREKGERLDYVAYVANPVTGDETWSVFVKGGGDGYSANPSGRRLCPLGKQC